jgi:class 3 adenylate cyclase
MRIGVQLDSAPYIRPIDRGQIMPKPYLEWVDDNQQVHQMEIVDKIFIGRSWRGVDPQKRILVRNEDVSREHAVVNRSTERLEITDMSINGTWVNGIRLAAGASIELADGDVIRISGLSLQVHYPEDTSEIKENAASVQGTILTPKELLVTNVVVDVREFTTFSQAHSSLEVYALMKEIINEFSAIVYEFKGTIKDYAGDAVFAFWTHDIGPAEEQAVLACQAAIKQNQAVKEIQAKLSAKNIAFDNLQMGWGITTGTVTISHYGSRAADLALVGDCTNLAFRLSGMANKEISQKIVICNQTADMVGSKLAVADLGKAMIKGRQGLERVFALVHPQ